MAVQKIMLLGVPVFNCMPQDFEEEILRLESKEGQKQIVFLSVWDLLKARGKNTFAECVKNADLVLPVSKSILFGINLLYKQKVQRWNPFDTVIDIMTILENHYKSIYLLGGRKKTLAVAERNVKNTFKNLQIVGRFKGYYPKSVEEDVIVSIRKSSPSLCLISDGIREKCCWSYLHRDDFASSIFLYYADAIGIFSERITQVSKKTFERGNEIWHEIFHNPLKVFLVFPFIWYLLCLFCTKLFCKNKE